ncbi:MAG: hypothetical protein ACRD16_07315 [Thermoanaerobaculia bacterium]
MKRLFSAVGVAMLMLVAAGTLFAHDDVTIVGYISDSMCGLDHSDMQRKHGGIAQYSTAVCTKDCVEGGAKYVLADTVGNKTYNIENQKKVAGYAGQRVQIVGDLKGDKIDVEKIRLMP